MKLSCSGCILAVEQMCVYLCEYVHVSVCVSRCTEIRAQCKWWMLIRSLPPWRFHWSVLWALLAAWPMQSSSRDFWLGLWIHLRTVVTCSLCVFCLHALPSVVEKLSQYTVRSISENRTDHSENRMLPKTLRERRKVEPMPVDYDS